MTPDIVPFYHEGTGTLTYLAWDPASRDAVLVDPVLDFDPVAMRVSEESIDAVARAVEDLGLHLRAVLETHVHADHLSGAAAWRRRAGVPVAIGARVTEPIAIFRELLDRPDVPEDGSDFDRLLADGERWELGALTVEVLATPGHTPACCSYRVGDAVFVGDALFMPDFGTGRCDFPGGDAGALWDSVQGRLYALPPETRLFVGHDYRPGGRELRWMTTVGESRRANRHLRADTSREAFVAMRTARDATLALPRLLFHAVQVNIAAGRLPPADARGRRYLKLPIDPFGS